MRPLRITAPLFIGVLLVCLGLHLLSGPGDGGYAPLGGGEPASRGLEPTGPERLHPEAGRAIISQPFASETVEPASSILGNVQTPSGDPLAGTLIAARPWPRESPLDDGSVIETTSLPDGGFMLRVPSGVHSFEIRALARGYLPRSLFGVRPGEQVRITLDEGHEIAGMVLSPEGPVEGARISWSEIYVGGTLRGETSSKADGTFVLRGLPPAFYITVSSSGFGGEIFRVLAEDHQEEPLVIHVQKTRPCAGVVLETGTEMPIAGAQVELWAYTVPGRDMYGREVSGSRRLAVTRTDGQGVFRLSLGRSAHPESAVDHLALWVSSPGRAPRWVEVLSASTAMEVELFSGRTISGRVVDERGSPVPGCVVRARSSAAALCETHHGPDFESVRDHSRGVGDLFGPLPPPDAPFAEVLTSITDEQGYYSIDGIPHDPAKNYEVSVWPGWHETLAVSVAVRGPVPPDIPDIIIPDDYLLQGRGQVVAQNGSPVAGAVVTYGGTCSATDDHGRFVFHLPEWLSRTGDSVELEVKCSGFARYSRTIAYRELIRGDLRIVLRKGYTLSGKVFDAQGFPVRSAHIIVFDESSSDADMETVSGRGLGRRFSRRVARCQSSVTGEFRLVRMPAIVRVRALYPHRIDGPYASGYITHDCRDGPLDIVLEGLDATDCHCARSVGVFVRSAGESIKGLHGTLESGGRVLQGQVRAANLIEFQSVSFGSYVLTIAAEGYAPLRRIVHIGSEERIEVTLSEGAVIVGRVVGILDSAWAREASVVLRDDAGRKLSVAVVDTSGRFTFRGLDRGSYALEIGRGEHCNERADVSNKRFATVEATRVVVEEDQSRMEVEVPVVPTLRTEITVSGSSDQGSSSRVRITISDERGTIWFSGTPDQGGDEPRGLLLALPPGAYTASVQSADSIWRFMVTAGDKTHLVLNGP